MAFLILFLQRGTQVTEASSTTRLLLDWGSGNSAALQELTPHVYRELHALARAYLNRGRHSVTLQPTALINEVYLRLIDQSPVRWEDRSHFFGVSARLMRNILVDYTRARRAAKRGGSAIVVTLEETMAFSPTRHPPDILDVDSALSRLASFDERKAKVIELRYFGGMTREEVASAAGLTLATVKRDLRLAEAWLRRELQSRG
jgi:RNA polymerase sigma factor (TIGR02999 family)